MAREKTAPCGRHRHIASRAAVDIALLKEGAAQPEENMRRASVIVAELSLAYDVVLSCIYVSAEQYAHEQSPLLLNIRREGLLL